MCASGWRRSRSATKSMKASNACFSWRRSWAQNGTKRSAPSSMTYRPNRYSRPPSSSGSPSMSKNMSPGSGRGRRARPRGPSSCAASSS
ncbi:Uncharacterised protein [Bordetella pertussis]|nr:Uncharacterised protein [Bordetella pertussis]